MDKPVWLWWSRVDATPPEVGRAWQAFLRRFDIEHRVSPAQADTRLDQAPTAPKPTRPGPGRPSGSKTRATAQRFDVGRIPATGEAYNRPTHDQKGTRPRRTG
nr:hypothetical protein GCM10017745_46920 [Saccharothrix mutabilis subsp. capreolus]